MPGMVVEIPVEVGQTVSQGDLLVILESMKMQNELKSPCDGIVTHVRAALGDSIEHNQVLVLISAEAIEA